MLYTQLADGHHEGLVPVVARPKVAIAKDLGPSDLCNLFAVTKNAKLGFTCKNFSSSKQAGFTALCRDPVVFNTMRLNSVCFGSSFSAFVNSIGCTFGGSAKIVNRSGLGQSNL